MLPAATTAANPLPDFIVEVQTPHAPRLRPGEFAELQVEVDEPLRRGGRGSALCRHLDASQHLYVWRILLHTQMQPIERCGGAF